MFQNISKVIFCFMEAVLVDKVKKNKFQGLVQRYGNLITYHFMV